MSAPLPLARAVAMRHHLAGLANDLLGHASRFWTRSAKADNAADRAWFEKVGERYYRQSCDLIDWADALALDPTARPSSDIAVAVASHLWRRP